MFITCLQGRTEKFGYISNCSLKLFNVHLRLFYVILNEFVEQYILQNDIQPQYVIIIVPFQANTFQFLTLSYLLKIPFSFLKVLSSGFCLEQSDSFIDKHYIDAVGLGLKQGHSANAKKFSTGKVETFRRFQSENWGQMQRAVLKICLCSNFPRYLRINATRPKFA